jgi:hypothetical protein
MNTLLNEETSVRTHIHYIQRQVRGFGVFNMKEYKFELIIKEGCDEFWESLEGKSGCDELTTLISQIMEDGGFWPDTHFTLSLTQYKS